MKKQPPNYNITSALVGNTATEPTSASTLPTWKPSLGLFARAPQLTDLLLAAVFFVLTLMLWFSNATHLDINSFIAVLGIQCGFIACLGLLWRRSHPWQVHALVLGATALLEVGFPQDGIVGMVLSLYSLGRYEANARISFVSIIATLIFVAVDYQVFVNPTAAATVSAFLVWALWYVGRRLRFRGEYLRLLEERAEYLERHRNAEAEQAVTVERARIAREMHDVVAHQVSLMTVQAGAARTILATDPSAAHQALTSVESAGRQALSELRQLLSVLRPQNSRATLSPQPNISDLPKLIEQVQKAIPDINIETQGELSRVPNSVGLTTYRIIQEALTNAVKHVGAMATVRVSLRVSASEIHIRVKDDGDKQALAIQPLDGGHGLVGMAERVEHLGGWLTAANTADGGFEVCAFLPFRSKDSS